MTIFFVALAAGFLGSIVGFFLCALLAVGGRADDCAECRAHQAFVESMTAKIQDVVDGVQA